MKKTNISEKDHKEWAELNFILIHSSRKCEEKTTRFSNVIFHWICPFWNWEVNEVRNNEHRISNLKNKHSFKALHIHCSKYKPLDVITTYVFRKLFQMRFCLIEFLHHSWCMLDLQFAKNSFLGMKWPFLGQPDNHIGWATSMLFLSTSPIFR